jgi:MFS family permease
VGIFFAGLAAQLMSWRWYFFIGAILTAISFFLAWASMPSDKDERAALGIKMDWPGTVLIVSGLILIVFAFTALPSAPQSWKTPYIPVTFSAGIVILCVAAWWEGWMAEQPLLPVEIFKVKMFPAVVGAMFMQYGGLGIFLLYTTY